MYVISEASSLKLTHLAHQLNNAYALSQVGESLSVLCVSGLVLDEDGTGVDTEGFFQALPENSVLMVLEKDQKWTPDRVRVFGSSKFNH